MKYKRKGAVILSSDKGIILVSKDKKEFSLPGGIAKFYETRKNAARREVFEETNLKISNLKYFFSYLGDIKKTKKGKIFRKKVEVFTADFKGDPKAGKETKKIIFWNKKSKIKLSDHTKIVLDKFLK